MAKRRSAREATSEQRKLVAEGRCAGKNSTYGKPDGTGHPYCMRIEGWAVSVPPGRWNR